MWRGSRERFDPRMRRKCWRKRYKSWKHRCHKEAQTLSNQALKPSSLSSILSFTSLLPPLFSFYSPSNSTQHPSGSPRPSAALSIPFSATFLSSYSFPPVFLHATSLSFTRTAHSPDGNLGWLLGSLIETTRRHRRASCWNMRIIFCYTNSRCCCVSWVSYG